VTVTATVPLCRCRQSPVSLTSAASTPVAVAHWGLHRPLELPVPERPARGHPVDVGFTARSTRR
jgi:hypothetical protein